MIHYSRHFLLNPFWLLQKLTFYQFFEVFMALAAIVGVGSALDSSSRASSASRQQAQQALDNARRQADNVMRRAEEIAYQNELTRQSLEIESEHLAYEYAYASELVGLQTEQDIREFERGIEFIDLDLESLGITSEFKAQDAETQAAIYEVRAGLAIKTAKYLEGVQFNTVKEFGLVEVLSELDLYNIYASTQTAIEEVDFYAESALLESKAIMSQSKQNLANAVVHLEKGKFALDITRRDNLRTLGAVKAKATSLGRAYSGSAKDIFTDRARDIKATEKLNYYAYQLEANAQVVMSRVKRFSSEMKKREATFISNKRVDILEAGERKLTEAATRFEITNIGYENTLAKLGMNIEQAYGEASIYGMYAEMSKDLAIYIRDTTSIQTRELLLKRQNAIEDINISKNLGLIELNRVNEIYRYQTDKISFTVSSLEEDTIRAYVEAEYLAAEYLEAGRRGYSLNLQQGRAQSTGYLYQAAGSLFQSLGYAYNAYAGTPTAPTPVTPTPVTPIG